MRLFLDQELRHRQVEIVSAFFEATRLIPEVLAVSIIVCPGKGVIVQRELISITPECFPMILLHELKGHDVWYGDVGICSVAKDVTRHHPPGQLHRLTVGIDQPKAKQRIHHARGVPRRVEIQVQLVRWTKPGNVHPLPNRRVRAEDQIDLPSSNGVMRKE